MRNQNEHNEQVALFQWAKMAEGKYPELALLFSIPNGGARHIAVARKLKAEGVKAGVPDICLSAPRGIYHGFFIEMKSGKNKPTAIQLEWHERLRTSGYRVEVCHNWSLAKMYIEEYLGAE